MYLLLKMIMPKILVFGTPQASILIDVVPQIIAGGVGGVVLDAFQVLGKNKGIDNLGYKAIFIISSISFILGAIAARSLKNNKPKLV